jgi:peptidoglycan hydrolase-like protein with peptidoglycan-binding domain
MMRPRFWQLRIFTTSALIIGIMLGLAAGGIAADKNTLLQADMRFAREMEQLANKNKISPQEEEKQAREWFDSMMKKAGDDAKGIILFVQRNLGAFGYGVGLFDGVFNEQTRRALREYQNYNKLPATGELDWKTFDLISKDAQVLDDRPIALATKSFYQDEWDRFVSAKGTWVMENDKIAYPYNVSEISCYRELRYCFEATADMIATAQMTSHGFLWPVAQWDDVEVISKADDSGVCSRTTLHLNRATKSVTKLTTPKINEGVCKDNKEILSKLVDGNEVWSQRFNHYHLERQRIERGHWEQFEKQWRSK